MTSPIWRLATVVLVLTPGSLALAAEWFVAQKDPLANDRNPGTAGIWWDCGGTGLRIIGNGFWSNRAGSGIYNEWGVNE